MRYFLIVKSAEISIIMRDFDDVGCEKKKKDKEEDEKNEMFMMV